MSVGAVGGEGCVVIAGCGGAEAETETVSSPPQKQIQKAFQTKKVN